KRSIFKQSDHSIWCMIHDIVQKLHLSVQLVKIQAHSNNFYNDQVDLLAKDATNSQEIVFTSCSTSLIAFEPTWNHLCIDSYLRHFVRFISRTKVSPYELLSTGIRNISPTRFTGHPFSPTYTTLR